LDCCQGKLRGDGLQMPEHLVLLAGAWVAKGAQVHKEGG
jgi:hypothetical protein